MSNPPESLNPSGGGERGPIVAGWLKWAAAATVAFAELVQKLTPMLDFLPRWTSLFISTFATLAVVLGAFVLARYLWKQPERKGRVWAVGVLLAAYLPCGWYYAWKFGIFRHTDPSTVAVFAFDAAGYGAREIGLDVAAQLSSMMDGAGGLRTVNARKVAYNYTGARNEVLLDSASGRYIARRMGAGLFVMGSVNLIGKRVVLSAALFDVETGRRLAEVSVADDETNLAGMADRLAIDLVAQYRAGMGALPLLKGAGQASGSVREYNVYLRAEDAIRKGDFLAAHHMLEPLEERASPYTPASYGMAVTGLWTDRVDQAERAISRSLEHLSGLPARDTLLLRAMSASMRGMRDSAQHLLARLLWSFGRDDPEANYLLGELLFRTNPYAGEPRGQSQDHFGAVLNVDSLHFRARWHVLMLALAAADDSTARKQVESLLRGAPDSAHALPLWLLRECLTSGPPACSTGTLVDRVAASSRGAWLAVNLLLARWRASPESGWITPVLSILEKNRESPERERKRFACERQAQVALARGEWDMAMECVRQLSDQLSAIYTGLFVTLPFVRPSASELDSAKAALEVLQIAIPPFPTTEIASRPAQRAFLLGLIAVQQGKPGDAAKAIERLASEPSREAPWPALATKLSRDLGNVLRSETTPDPHRALELLSGLEVIPEYGLHGSIVFGHDRERYRRAEHLYVLGRREEARRWFASLRESPSSAIYDAPASYWIGRIHEDAGRRSEAITEYRRVLALWSGCDPHFSALRDDAFERLSALDERKPDPRCRAASREQ